MLVVYDTMSGNVRDFVAKVGMRSIQLDETLVVDEPFVLVTYTIRFGQVPEKTQRFLQHNGHLMLAVATSGDKIWGDNYGRAGRVISANYQVPILHTFEKKGTVDDVGYFIREVERIVVESNSKMDRAQ